MSAYPKRGDFKMEGETLVEWMLRCREEIARNAAADGVVRDTMERLKRKLRNVYRMHDGSSPERKMILWPESGKKVNPACD